MIRIEMIPIETYLNILFQDKNRSEQYFTVQVVHYGGKGNEVEKAGETVKIKIIPF